MSQRDMTYQHQKSAIIQAPHG